MTTTHRETKTLPFTPKQLFNLVADVQHYPQFLPWCRAVRIHHHQEKEKENEFVADVLVGFKTVKESYTTLVRLDPHRSVSTHLIKGPFHQLECEWLFTPGVEAEKDVTHIEFFITFAFRYKWLGKLIGPLFDEASLKIMDAFEKRAYALYTQKT